ncbi:MAG: nicotinate (nicotinamide) nucleotide adenylyltransferase [Planctomycetota bacterium]|jgi:nicotinate-nucleotide adenylyltransferase
MRTGIYGGSFDPVHSGHIAAAVEVLHRRALDRVFLIPAASPPHKPGGCVAPFADRVAMARLAAAPEHGIDVLDIEGARDGPSYTVETLDALRALYPDDHFELLVGADMLADLPRWKDPDRIVKNAQVVAFARPGSDLGAAWAAFEAAFGPDRAVLVEMPPISAASTAIRERLERGENVADLVPSAVAAYIRERHLYAGGSAGGYGG